MTERNFESAVCKIGETRYKYVKITVYLVQKCNFNDERLIADKCIETDTIRDGELVWLDPYLGKGGSESIAVSAIDGATLTLLHSKDGRISETSSELTHYFSDDYDKTYIISSHVELSNYKL